MCKISIQSYILRVLSLKADITSNLQSYIIVLEFFPLSTDLTKTFQLGLFIEHFENRQKCHESNLHKLRCISLKLSTLYKIDITLKKEYPVDTARKLNVHKTFRGRLLNVLCTFNLRPVSTGYI